MLAEDAARGPLAKELGAHLGPSLERLPPVVRVDTLRVQLKIPARNLNVFALSRVWARAFTLAFHEALAHPPGDGIISSRRYESEAAYRARMLRHLAANGLAHTWEFPELLEWRGSRPWEAALEILIRDPQSTPEILQQLRLSGSLEGLLNILDDSALERLMLVIASREEQSPALTPAGLVKLGRSAAGEVIRKWPLGSRRQAFRLWARLQCVMPLRTVWHGLRLLVKFLEMPALLTLHDPALFADPIPFPPWCLAVAGQFAGGARNAAQRSIGEASPYADLISVLEMLRPLVPSAASMPISDQGAEAKWIASNSAGILLMLSIAQRLDLWRFSRAPALVGFGGQRAVSFLLAGVGMALLNEFNSNGTLDPAVAVFAGMFEQPDLACMRYFFSTADVHAIASFVKADSWTDALDSAASEMTRCFAGLVRGFRNSSRDAIVRQFLRIPGRVLIEPHRVLVVLDPSPWAVALRISGMDDPLQRVEWMSDRSAHFVLEGL